MSQNAPPAAALQDWWANNEAYEQAMAMYVKGVEPLVNLPPGFRQGLYVLPAQQPSNPLMDSAVHNHELEQAHQQNLNILKHAALASPLRASPLLTFAEGDTTHLRNSNSSIPSPHSSGASSCNSSPSGSWVSVKRELESDVEKNRKVPLSVVDESLAGVYKELLELMGWNKDRDADSKRY